ncbi:hypothetical protein PsYK624_018390 [Phanerochaete sordida]|uniref:Pentacotripeptide-repeat region of PRORP domain-containing protein n=1 Tax=Phanerochaete sordida TaxID=48140 RepID=A0A9P3G0L9_9APHY|nr:hypothetical protein PsYK624_018390 [Phanerochaete sordida]
MVDRLFRRRAADCTVEDLKALARNPEAVSHLEDPDKARQLAVLMVNTGVPRRACQVFLLARYFGCRFKQNAYEGVAYQLAQTAQWAEMPSLVALGRRQTGRTTSRLLNWRARALVEISHFGLLDGVLEEFEEEKIVPNRRTYHTLVSGHLRNRDLAKVKDCLGWMEDAGFPMDASTHALLVSSYRSLGRDSLVQSQALGSLQDLGERNATAVVNSLIQLSLDTRDVRSALKYLAFFDNPSTHFPHTRDRENSTTADEDKPQTSNSGPAASQRYPTLSPDIATFTMLTNYAARMRDISLAVDMVERVKHFGVRADDIYIAALVRAYCAVGQVSVALRITATTCKDIPSALSVLRDLGLKDGPSDEPVLGPTGVGISIRILNALLKGVLEAKGLPGMRVLTRLMRDVGLEPNEETIEVFMSYLISQEKVSPRQLKNTLLAVPRRIRPTLRHVNILLDAIIGKRLASQYPRGWTAVAAAANSGQPFTPDTSSHLDPGPAPGILEQMAKNILRGKPTFRGITRRLLQSLQSRNIRPDRAMVDLIMRQEALVKRNMSTARTALRIMLARGMHPNEYHFATIMQGYALSGDVRTAEKVLERAKEAGYGTDPVLYTILVHGYARLRHPKEAARIFQLMLKDDIQPDVPSVDALASAYFAVRAFSAARRILLRSWERFAPFPSELAEANLRTLAVAFRKLAPHGIPPLNKRSRRVLRFKLKRIVQNFGARRFGERSRRGKTMRHTQAVSRTISHNKHAILQ